MIISGCQSGECPDGEAVILDAMKEWIKRRNRPPSDDVLAVIGWRGRDVNLAGEPQSPDKAKA